ncbi:hypothetical protein TSST111916_13675 [Tsukamurella strandjordii]|uniref:hypothetical protein n=1 Tax=Tsukamurella TaxID=2060 RepID=UPI001C7CCA75|nr:hypothetical protein [Tsukamurella sp. TY48]GIZ97648.1 hypothetical protein TTY48_22600 [Tsukamurella sp. TY48]
MTHRLDKSTGGTGLLRGSSGRFLALGAAAVLCATAIAVVVGLSLRDDTTPVPASAPSSVAPTSAVHAVAPAPNTPSPSGAPSSAPAEPTAAPTTAAPAPTTAQQAPAATAPVRTAVPRTTARPAPSTCRPQTKWVFRPSTGSYERMTIPC